MKSKNVIRSVDFRKHPSWFRYINTLWRWVEQAPGSHILQKDDLIRSARQESGLTDLGRDFRDEPLDRLLDSLNREAQLHPLGRFITRKRIINLLMVRLRAEYWFRKYPGILDQEIYPPLVIIGLQRTGTTKLHRLLTADPDNRVLRSWEAINPAPFRHQPNGTDRRIRSARISEKALRFMAPGFFAIHPVEYAAPEEDILLLDVTFLSTTPEATAHVPSYASWLEKTDQSCAYAYAGKLLKLLQWQKPGVRWVLKSPHHLEFLPLLERHYHRPRFLWTHRDITRCIPSFLSMVCHSRTLFSDKVSMEEVAGHWIRKTSHMLKKGLEYRAGRGNAGMFTDILYEELVRDPMQSLERVYAPYGGINEPLRKRFRTTEVENPYGKYGIHEYGPEEFGIRAGELIRMNGDYQELYSSLTGQPPFSEQ